MFACSQYLAGLWRIYNSGQAAAEEASQLASTLLSQQID